MTDLVDSYLSCWNETDPDTRLALVERCFSEHATYVDPLAEVRGREAIAATIGAVQAQFPAMVFRPEGALDAHHRQARFGWALGPLGEPAVAIGFDVVTTDDDGQIEQVLGFLDLVPGR